MERALSQSGHSSHQAQPKHVFSFIHVEMAKQLSIFESLGKKDPNKATITEEERRKAKREHDNEYDRGKRKRHFQESWKVGRPWMEYDDSQHVMFCKLCRDNKYGHAEEKGSFVVGTNSFQHTSVSRHEHSDKHIREQKAADCHSLPQNEQPAEQSLQMLQKEHREQLVLKFRNAHALAKKTIPFTVYVWMNVLDKKKGLDVVPQYLNIKSAAIFVHHIAEVSCHTQCYLCIKIN